jgi:nicotinamide-nucleotide amidase
MNSAAPDPGRRTLALSAEILALSTEAIALLIARSDTLATAESLTGGMVAVALTSVPGASAAFRGGVVSYATDLKAALLGVPADLLARHGAVHPEVAVAMAGVAGPEPADGQPVGTVHIAVTADGATATRALALSGDRHQIRVATVEQALGLLVGMLREDKL